MKKLFCFLIFGLLASCAKGPFQGNGGIDSKFNFSDGSDRICINDSMEAKFFQLNSTSPLVKIKFTSNPKNYSWVHIGEEQTINCKMKNSDDFRASFGEIPGVWTCSDGVFTLDLAADFEILGAGPVNYFVNYYLGIGDGDPRHSLLETLQTCRDSLVL